MSYRGTGGCSSNGSYRSNAIDGGIVSKGRDRGISYDVINSPYSGCGRNRNGTSSGINRMNNNKDVSSMCHVIHRTDVSNSSRAINGKDVSSSSQVIKINDVSNSSRAINGNDVSSSSQVIKINDVSNSSRIINGNDVSSSSQVIKINDVNDSDRVINGNDVSNISRIINGNDVTNSSNNAKEIDGDDVISASDVINSNAIEGSSSSNTSIRKINGTGTSSSSSETNSSDFGADDARERRDSIRMSEFAGIAEIIGNGRKRSVGDGETRHFTSLAEDRELGSQGRREQILASVENGVRNMGRPSRFSHAGPSFHSLDEGDAFFQEEMFIILMTVLVLIVSLALLYNIIRFIPPSCVMPSLRSS